MNSCSDCQGAIHLCICLEAESAIILYMFTKQLCCTILAEVMCRIMGNVIRGFCTCSNPPLSSSKILGGPVSGLPQCLHHRTFRSKLQENGPINALLLPFRPVCIKASSHCNKMHTSLALSAHTDKETKKEISTLCSPKK